MNIALPKFRRAALAAGISFFVVACGGGGGYDNPPAGQTETITSVLSGDQEAPERVNSGATGNATFTLDRATRTLSGTVEVDGVSATLAHIHAGAAGEAGAVVLPLTLAAGQPATLAPTVLSEDQLQSLDAGGLYVNVHSEANPTGEIRGQLGRDVFTARLSGDQETTPVASAGSGLGFVALDPITRQLSGEVEIEGFDSTVAHIHAGAFGSNGAVLIELEDHGGHGHYTVPANTVLSAEQVASLRAGGLYFNAHSDANPTGEVRGQIGQRVFLGAASGAQEVPANASTATGGAVITYDQISRQVQGSITVQGIAATVAHVHMGAAGVNGPVVLELSETAAGSGVWAIASGTVLSAEQAAALMAGELYFNAHSAAFSGGEIRAQLSAR